MLTASLQTERNMIHQQLVISTENSLEMMPREAEKTKYQKWSISDRNFSSMFLHYLPLPSVKKREQGRNMFAEIATENMITTNLHSTGLPWVQATTVKE